MINGNGFLFEFSNVENLKNVIIDVSNLTRKEIELMSEKSRKLFEENWTIESIQNKWNEILINYDTISVKRT
jgi:glycosyltransferase involved in cell wall biosynthesis